MTRTSIAQLDHLAELIDLSLGHEPGTHTVQGAYGRPRLYRKSGSVEVSRCLPAGESAEWIRAYNCGIIAGVQAGWCKGASARQSG